MSELRKTITIVNQRGLHARASATGQSRTASKSSCPCSGARGATKVVALIASARHAPITWPQMQRASQKRAYAEFVRKVTSRPRKAPPTCSAPARSTSTPR